MSGDTDNYVLDTSAWFALMEDEDGADTVQDVLESAREGEATVSVSFMSFMEVYYITLQERDAAEARERLRLMSALPVTCVESSPALGLLAGGLKAQRQLSVADAWIAALAQQQGATLIHKDPEYEAVEAEVNVLKLPYKIDS